MSLVHAIARDWQDDALAFTGDVPPTTYAEVRRGIGRARALLRSRGLRPGDRIAVQLGKTLAFAYVLLAALSEGIAVVPLNDRASPDETRHALDDAGVKSVFVAAGSTLDDPRRLEVAAWPDPSPPGPPPAADQLALVMYTSGTTGRPKGAQVTHGNLLAAIEALHTAWAWTDRDVLAHTLPIFHVHGLVVALLGALRAGATTAWLDRFDAAALWDAIARHRVTIVMGVPTHYRRMLATPGDPDLSSVRLFTCGSAPLPAEVFASFERRFGHRIVERYGMTETGIVLSNRLDAPRAGVVGFPLPGVEARVDAPHGQPGELRIRGPSVFAGYLGNPDATARALEDGWMHTGDEAVQEPDGAFRILGRRDDLILSGGFNVYPEEVERVLLTFPGVAEAAVVGVPDDDLGARVVASLVGDDRAGDAVLAHAREHLAPYKVPRAVAFVPALPRNALGKLLRGPVRTSWTSVQVRPAEAAEAERIAAWNVAMARETEALQLDPEVARAGAHRVFAEDTGAFYLIATRGGQPVGQTMVTREWSDWRDRYVWWIQSVYVIPEARGGGVYRALHQAVADRARDAGAAGLRLYVARDNAAAAAVYRRVGMAADRYDLFEHLFDEPPGGHDPSHG